MAGPRDDDPWLIDFFDEGETRENATADPGDTDDSEWFPAEPRVATRAGRFTFSLDPKSPVQRLAAAVVAVLVATVVIAFATRGGSEASADSSYFAKLAVPAQDSANVGLTLANLLGTAPVSAKVFEASLGTLVSRQQQDTSETLAISAPPELRAEQEQAVSAMQFRSEGLSGLLRGFHDAVAHETEADDWPSELAVQAESLITSDVIWRDLFIRPTKKQLKGSGVTGATPPSSAFVTNANLFAVSAMRQVLRGVARAGAVPSTVVTSSTASLQLGDTGPAVKQWQTELNKWIARQTGIPLLTVNGIFDSQTQTATMAFQTDEQIGVDGVVGPVTRGALTTALAQST